MTQRRTTGVSLLMLAVALLATAGASWAAGYQYNLQCNGCHGMPPLDAGFRNWSTGAFQGNHTTHMGANAAATKCDICHYDAAVTPAQTKPSSFTSGHRSGQIQMFGKYTKGIFFNQTSVPNLTNATCSNVNCHFEKLTPTWASTPLGGGPSDCETCHTSAPPRVQANAQTTAGHGSHTKYPSMAWVTACDVCHVNHLFEPKPFQHATSAGNRGVYVATSLRYTGPTNDYLPSQTNVFGKCSNTYCHSNGNPAPAVQGYTTVAYRMYSTPVFGTTGNGCGICHAASPTTNAHNYHVVTKGYGCVVCHSATVSSNTVISNLNNHDNGSKEVAFSGIGGTGSTCSTSYCHATQTGTPTAPSWTSQNSAPCGSCHFATNATLATKAHGPHLNSASYAYGPTALQGTAAAGSCQTCHTTYTATSATHVNGVVDVITSCTPCHVTTPTWAIGRLSCESCHAGTTRSVIQGITAPDMTLSVSKGHTQPTFTGTPTCNSCHNPNSTHISGTLGDNVRLTLANDNSQCRSCHNAGLTKPAFQNMSTHISVYGGGQDINGFLCKRCHDPHGTTNLSMIRTTIKKGVHATATSFTIAYTDRVNGLINTTTNRGLCQVCHTKTKFYRSGIAENNHPTSGCFECHAHNAKGGAFKPSGTCDGCHGYPPVPKGLPGLTFGTAGNYANARYEDYSGGGGAHAVPAHVKLSAVPGEGWANCAMCHNGGSTGATPNHRMITPIKTNIGNVTINLDQKLRFNATTSAYYKGAKLVYPGNSTGTCNNVECHFKPSPRWSIQR